VVQLEQINRFEQQELQTRAALHGLKLEQGHGRGRGFDGFDSSRTDRLNERIKARYRRR